VTRTLRQNRGYAWEHYLANFINTQTNWNCWRLGSSTTNLPDLVAVNNIQKRMLVFECKSGGSRYKKQKNGTTEVVFADRLAIPVEEVERCISLAQTFTLYDGDVVFSFKFSKGVGKLPKVYHYVLPKEWYGRYTSFGRVICLDNGTCDIACIEGDKTAFNRLDYNANISNILASRE